MCGISRCRMGRQGGWAVLGVCMHCRGSGRNTSSQHRRRCMEKEEDRRRKIGEADPNGARRDDDEENIMPDHAPPILSGRDCFRL